MKGELWFIGLGLCSENDLSMKAVRILRSCEKIFIDQYTSIIPKLNMARLERLIGKPVIPLRRRDLEDDEASRLIKAAEKNRVALIVPGDPFVATTHMAIRLQAEKHGVRTKVLNSASIITAIYGATGLHCYKFGRPVTIVRPRKNLGYSPTTHYEVLRDNLKRGLHTFFFLELDVETGDYVSVNEALRILRETESMFKEGIIRDDTLAIGLSRVGCKDAFVRAAPIKVLEKIEFGSPPHSLIIPGKLHPLESEALVILCGACPDVINKEWKA